MYSEYKLKNLRLVEDVYSHDTRKRSDFYVGSVTTSFAQNSLFYKGLVKFNNWPQDK